MTKKVTIYNKDGGAELHTLPNARDLIQAGWSWTQNKESTPFDQLPTTVALTLEQKKALEAKKIGQEIFDRFGTGATEDILAPTKVDDDVPEEAAPAAEVVTPVVEAQAEEPAVEAKVELPRAGSRRFGKDKS